MLIEAIETALKVKRPDGDILLTPGMPVEFTEVEGLRLLSKAKGKVRRVEPSETVIEPAQRPDGSHLSPVYWERLSTGEILGPAQITHFVKTGTGAGEQFWVVIEFKGHVIWVRDDSLRSKKQFETQTPLREVELIQEPK